MCYAIPGKIVSIRGRAATIDYFGERKTASIIGDQGPGLKTGDFVYAQGGIIIEKIDRDEALAILKDWKERFFELKKRDEEIAKIKNQGSLASILQKAESGELLTRSEMIKIIETRDPGLEKLFGTANQIRSQKLGNSCCVHGIIEFSNHCKNSCTYCGISKNNKKIKRYRMSIDAIVRQVDFAVDGLGFKALVLQSGEDEGFGDDDLVELVKRIRERYGVLLFLSIGERTFDCYRRLYEAGAYGALLRFETSDKKIYSIMRPGKRLEDRLDLIRKLISHGFVVATGFIVGLPGTTEQDLINDILLTKSLKPDMYSIGPLIPHPDTPLADAKKISLEHALKTISLCRFVDPKSKILVTTALETLDNEGKRKGLLAGGNSLMINVTPERHRKKYEIYPGKVKGDRVEDEIKETLDILYSLGRAPTDLGR